MNNAFFFFSLFHKVHCNGSFFSSVLGSMSRRIFIYYIQVSRYVYVHADRQTDRQTDGQKHNLERVNSEVASLWQAQS